MAINEKFKDKIGRLKNSKLLEKIERIKKLKILKKIKENKRKFIKKVNQNKGRIFAGISITAVMAVSFKSDDSLVFNTSKISVPVTKNTVILGDSRLSTAEFYRSLEDKNNDGRWFYSNSKSKERYGINTRVDQTYLNNQKANLNKNISLTIRYKDVYLSYKIDTLKRDTTNVVCYMSEKLTNKNSSKDLGWFQSKGREIVVNRFHPDSTLSVKRQQELQKTIDERYDTKLIETETHEFGHDENDQKGINARVGLGAERDFKLSKHDEVVANIRQLLKQRQNYILNGDEKYITSKFKFYLDKIKENNITPSAEFVSLGEAKIIGEGVRDMWEKQFSETYRDDHFKMLRKNFKQGKVTFESLDAEERYEKILDRIYDIKTPKGETVSFRYFIKDFELTEDETKEIEKIKNENPLNEMDKLGMILDRYGKKAYHTYIVEQKQKVKEEDRRKELEEARMEARKQNFDRATPNKQHDDMNREAILNENKRTYQNRRQRRGGRE
ncbi:MAG: hypothetical protein LBR70_02430 [Lactobacillaceae bacterium]|jgi:hypothetical protein|nr:hypothetical protein [Lactobacillaceae bacterium]